MAESKDVEPEFPDNSDLTKGNAMFSALSELHILDLRDKFVAFAVLLRDWRTTWLSTNFSFIYSKVDFTIRQGDGKFT